MSAVLALRAAQKAGASVSVRDGRLIVRSEEPLPSEILADLRTYRDRLVEILLEPPACRVAADAEAEYDRLGEQIDVLADRAKAARLRGETVKAERLGAEVRALVVGPYRCARERYAALLDQAGETKA